MSSSTRPSSTISVGGKGSSLSPAALYAVSRGLAAVSIDSAALEKLSRSKRPPPLNLKDEEGSSNIRLLNPEESRAALAVLLNKLLLSDAGVRPALPVLIEQTLALSSGVETLDFGSALGFLNSLCRLHSKTIDEIGAGREEIGIFEGSCAASIGICAMLDCCSSSLVKVSEAVAALSCEAARASVEVFDSFGSGDGLSVKDENDVAADMKALLFGSKLVGQNSFAPFNEIPTISGSYREAVKSLHSRIRIELNSILEVKKTMPAKNQGKEKALVGLVLQLAWSIQSMSVSSLTRAKLDLEAISDTVLRLQAAELLEKECPGLEILSNQLHSITEKASELDYVAALHLVYYFMVRFREILAWEAAIALFVIDMDDLIDKPSLDTPKTAEPNGQVSKSEKKSEKKKKKTLGKGSSVIWRLLRDKIMNQDKSFTKNVQVMVDWAHEFSVYFDPKDSGLDVLLEKVKEIVESNEVRRLPKIPKGTRDFGKEQMAIRERAFSIISGVFKMHGAVALDTPVFELRETLMGKYGEDSKLIYDLADQGGELCSLRYDLTVPFARYLAMKNISAMKRYQIAKVYRRDNPSKGRFREFYQCDFDIAGQYDPMDPDFEVVKVLTELLDRLDIGSFEIKLNHRKLLDGMLEICGVSSEKFRTVCSSIDKLDKQSFEQIKKELVEEKGISSETADKIGNLVKKRGPPLEILSELKAEGSSFLGNSGSMIALTDLELLFKALEKAKSLDKVVFDLSLARGLDYYTGVIFEAVFKGTTQVGSIAAGGRYDNLVGMFSGKHVPAVGVSLGIERVFAIMEQQNQSIRASETEVLVAILGKDLTLAAEIVSELWNAKIKAEYGLHKNVKRHIDRAVQSGIPWVLFVGESEISSGKFKLKNIKAKQEVVVERETLAEDIQRNLKNVQEEQH